MSRYPTFRSIVVPVDASALAEGAIPYALALAERTHSGSAATPTDRLECSCQDRITVHRTRGIIPKALLACGILSSLLYVAMNIVGALRFEGYDWLSQTVSELSAIDAPTRPLWVASAIPYTLLVVAFGWGVRKSAGQNRRLRMVGGLILAYGALGFLWPFAPMHLRGAGFAATDAMHIVLGSVTVVLMLLAVWCGAAALGRGFRVYSIVTLVIVLVFGALSGWEAPRIAANLPTPWLGLWERINIGAFLLWIVVLATARLRVRDSHSLHQQRFSAVPLHR